MTATYVLTPGASAVQLSSVLETGDVPIAGRSLLLQANASNTGVLYFGGNNVGANTSSSNYGFRIEIPVTSIPSAPVVFEYPTGSVSLDEFWVKAAVDTDKLHITVKD
jgi:hypothetical protein